MKQLESGRERPIGNTVHDGTPQVTAPADAKAQDNVGGGDHPPAGEQHGPPRGGHRQQVLYELVAGAGPAGADQDLVPEPGGDLPEGRGQHVPVAGERI